MSYLDSGYIAKFYVDEPDSPSVRRLTEALGEVHCAALGRAEVATALHRKLREGVFGEAEFREVIAQFEDDCSRGPWMWIPVTAALLTATVAVIRRVPRSAFLRAGDANSPGLRPGERVHGGLYGRPSRDGGGAALSCEGCCRPRPMTVFGFTLLGDGRRDVVDPRRRPSR